MKYYDITPQIDHDLAVFPGDTAFCRHVELDMQAGAHLTLSSFKTTAHIGAHTDAPSHYAPDGDPIHKRPLDYYMGRAQVIRAKPKNGQRLLPADIDGITIAAPRVLFRTGSFPNPKVWRNDFAALSPELIEYLVKQNVRLVGIDTPSIDPATATVLISHHAVHKNNLAILEGIILDEVPQGEYILVALPLPLVDGDASPVRAVLLPTTADLARN